MELLIRGRPIILVAFFVSLACIALGLYLDHHLFFAGSALATHAFLFLFTVTESFGRVARTRSKTARVMARVFFSIYVLAGLGFLSTWVVASQNVA
jgi:uncharacterized membrane protein